MEKLRGSIKKLAQAEMVFYLMPVLIVLLVIGTIAQREIGLYAAHQKYFASFIIWLGPLPLPGGYLILGLLTLNLTLKFLTASKWAWKKSGIILSHLGALILLIGGLLTTLSAEEKYMIIPENNQTPYMYDYHARELLIYKNDALNAAIPFEHIKAGKTLQTPSALPFTVNILAAFKNIDIQRREDSPDYDETKHYLGLAQFMALSAKKPSKDTETDLTALRFEIDGLDEAQNGLYITFDGSPKPIELTTGEDTYIIILGKQQSELPFSIRLIDFQKQTYEGTDLARSYSSDIAIIDDTIEWPARIEMNKPLRYKGYTFFQSSFNQTEDTEMTILSVVKNTGWLFPYIGTGILGIGLLLHLILVIKRRNAA